MRVQRTVGLVLVALVLAGCAGPGGVTDDDGNETGLNETTTPAVEETAAETTETTEEMTEETTETTEEAVEETPEETTEETTMEPATEAETAATIERIATTNETTTTT